MSDTSHVLSVDLHMNDLRAPILPETADEVMKRAIIQRLARDVSIAILEKEFDQDTAITNMTSGIRSSLQMIFSNVLKEEANERTKKIPKTDDVVLRHIEQSLGVNASPDSVTLSLPENFFNELNVALNDKKNLFDHLNSIRSNVKINRDILPLLRQLQTLDQDGWYIKEGGADRAYELLKPLVGDERFIIPHDEAELLYFLTYIPTSIRYMVQEFLIHQSHMTFVREEKNEAAQKSEPTEMYDLLTDSLKESIFVNDHWRRLCTQGASEFIVMEFAKMQIKTLQTKRRMKNLLETDSSHENALRIFIEYCKRFRHRMRDVDEKYGCYDLQQTDIGHGFSSHFTDSCRDMINPSRRNEESVEKTGALAVILEDDQAQMTNWQSLVTECTAYSLPADGTTAFETPSQKILELAENPNVRLFLIDIQNGEDRTAGIRVVDELIRLLLDICKKDPDLQANKGDIRIEPEKVRRIVLWSSSVESVEFAEKHLDSICSTNENKRYIDGMHHYHGAPINLHIQLKSDRLSFVD